MGRLEDVRDFSDLIVAHVGGRPLHVSDLGYAEDGIVEPGEGFRVEPPAQPGREQKAAERLFQTIT